MKNIGTRLLPLPVSIVVVGTLLFASPLAQAKPDITDKTVASAVEAELLLDNGVPAHRIDVNTSDGIVTLSGSVDNLAAKKRAVLTAESIKGVRSVVNLIKVRPIDRTDSEIRGDIVSALAVDPAADSYEVKVDVNNGKVTLDGSVDSYGEKRICEAVVMGVKGVKEIENNLAINYSSDRPDHEIKPEVAQLLDADVRIDDYSIDVSVEDGVVELTGYVGSAAEKTLARTIAWVAGVRQVDDSGLKVKWWARDQQQRNRKYVSRSDKEIEQAVDAALVNDPRVLSFTVGVDSHLGSVTLTGSVDNLKAKKAAEQDALNTVGVLRVINHIKVRPSPWVSDALLVDRVEAALARDPYVERHDMMVSCSNGRIDLYGLVDSDFEKKEAEDIASRVNGVVEVSNHLTVRPDPTLKPDIEITKDIENQLFWSPYVDSKDITVTVDAGVATLTGTVDSWDDFRRAAANAYEGGAYKVINKLRVIEAS